MSITMKEIEEIVTDLLAGNKIPAIKRIRAVANIGLKEAKDVADEAYPYSSSGHRSAETTRGTLIQELTRLGMSVGENEPVEFDGATWVDPTPTLIARAQLSVLEKILAQLVENNETMKDLMEEMRP